MPNPQPLILADPELLTPEGQRLWTTPGMVKPRGTGLWPTYSPHEVAKCFFGFSTAWLRKHMLELREADSEVVDLMRKEGSGQVIFRLYDIERLAYTLAERNSIDATRLNLVIRLVKTHAHMQGFL